MWSPTIRSNEIYNRNIIKHAGGLKANAKPDTFKYIAKLGEGENARYFYSQAEIDAYKKTLSKEELAKTDIKMMTEEEYDMDQVDKDALAKQIASRKAAEEATKKKPEEKPQKKEEEEKEDDKKKKSGSGGGKGKGGSGKGKGKGKGKDKGEKESKAKLPKLTIDKMSDKELIEYLKKNKELTDSILGELAISPKTDLNELKTLMDKESYSKEGESLFDVFKRYGYVQAPSKKNKKKSVKHSYTPYPNWAPSVRPDELYHWVPWGRSKDEHKYIEKIKEGNHYRYFYSKEELDAYKKLKNDVENKPVKTDGSNVIGKAKHFIDYDLTGRGYKRDAREQNKKIDQLNEMRKAHPLVSDRGIEKKRTVDERSNPIDNRSDKIREVEEKRNQRIKDAKSRNRTIENTSEFEKRRNLEKAEADFKDKSLVGNLTKVGDVIRKFNRGREDAKVADFMNKNRGTSEQWMKDLKIDKKDYDPEKDKGVDGANKLKKYLRDRAMLREGETLNDFLEKRGYAENKKGKRTYYRDSIKHFLESDLEIYSLLSASEELMHYGRRGMKWYQHIYGPVQSIAKYAQKAGNKLSDAKSKHDARAEAKWEKKKEKIIRSGDAKQIRKVSEKLTDDELRRADNRINEKNRLDSMTGNSKQQQAQNFVQNQGNQQSRDLIKDFNNLANTISTTYNNVDKMITAFDSAKKYLPENRAKEALKKEILKGNDIDKALDNWSLLNTKEQQELMNTVNNRNAVSNYLRNEAITKSNSTFGPLPQNVSMWLNTDASGYIAQKSAKGLNEEELKKWLTQHNVTFTP